MACMGPEMLQAPWDDATVEELKKDQAKGLATHYSPWHPKPYVCKYHPKEVLTVSSQMMICPKCWWSLKECFDPLW